MHRLPRNTLALAILLLIRVLPALSADRLPIEIAPVRWQLLPEAVKSVVVGPDGRTWYQLSADAQAQSDAETRAALENEYRQASPQISGASIALLEPAGRAWFYVKDAREVWGYDGHKWIERKASERSAFVGTCPTRGAIPSNVANQFVAGKTWFLEDHGLHVFNGKDWTYAAFGHPALQSNQYPGFAVSPNGKFAVAVAPQFHPRSNYLQNPDLWVCDGNEWQKRPAPWTERDTVVGTFCINDEGALCYVISGGQLHSFALFPDLEAVAGWIAKLDHADFQIRDQAYNQLADLGRAILVPLEEANRAARSPEATARLDRLLGEIRDRNQPADRRPNRPVTTIESRIGNCRVRNVHSVYQDDKGTFYVIAEAILQQGEPLINGLAIVDRSGKADVFRLATPRNVSLPFPVQGNPPILAPRGDTVWVSGGTFANTAVKLNLVTKQPSAQSPDPEFGVVQAVQEDGHAFLGRRRADPRGRFGFGLACFSPEIAEPKPSLVNRVVTIGWPAFLVASDGAVWAVRKGEGVARFDGSKWELIYPDKQGLCLPALAGNENVILCHVGDDYALFKDKQLVATGSLRKLIAAHPEIFIAAFPQSFTQRQGKQFSYWIATDTQRNIWLAERTTVGVYSKGKWIEANPAFTEAGSPGKGSCFLSTVGDGSKVYLSVLGFGWSFLGEIRDGRLILTEAPQGPTAMELSLGVRDGEGGLWVPGYAHRPPPNGGRIPPRRAFRIGEQGMLQEFAEEGWPVLADRSGNVWLAKMKVQGPQSHFSIWQNGKIVQQLDIAGADDVYYVFSDQPDSVYVCTTLGLHHFVAENADDGKLYRLRDTAPLPPLARGCEWTSSPLLGLIGRSFRGRDADLHLVQLPK